MDRGAYPQAGPRVVGCLGRILASTECDGTKGQHSVRCDSARLGRWTLRVDAHYVSIVAHMTIAELDRLAGSIEVFNGMLNRFLPVLVERSKKLPSGNSVTEELLHGATAELRSAMRHAKSVGEMHRTNEAEDLWCTFYMGLLDDADGPIGAGASTWACGPIATGWRVRRI